MKITYFTNEFPAVHKVYAENEIHWLQNFGHHIELVAVWGGKKEWADEINFPIIYLERDTTHWKEFFKEIFRHLFKAAAHLFLLFKFLGFKESIKYFSQYHMMNLENTDHIHAHFASNAALRGLLASKYYQIPFTCTGHGTELLLKKAPYLKYLIKQSHQFVTISHYNKEKLISTYKIPEERIHVKYCGVDTEYFKNNDFSRNELPIKLISVTALRKVKGVEYLVQACNLLKFNNIDFQCKIIGTGELKLDIAAQIQKYRLENDIKLMGALTSEEIRDELSKSAVFILPSISEGLPIAVMEAMSMQLAVIASNITGLPELIDNGVDGFLVDPMKPKFIAQKIIDLIHDPMELKNIQIAARRKIQKKFNLKDRVADMEKLFTHAH
ncbi:MAG: glycosyltransferase family 4 protein [Candidatus Marinimicrobia bacterium]|nr:glycosyltransferase family 4 protein [Candidatus Neomarinimicrobiota bacterium]